MNKNWEQCEEYVADQLGLKRTSRSGATSGDGDLKDAFIMVEVKDQAQVSFDEFWYQTIKDAYAYGREPVLVMRRPPEKYGRTTRSGPEYVACINLSYFKYLKECAEQLGDINAGS